MVSGDTCFATAQKERITLNRLMSLNPNLNCANLQSIILKKKKKMKLLIQNNFIKTKKQQKKKTKTSRTANLRLVQKYALETWSDRNHIKPFFFFD